MCGNVATLPHQISASQHHRHIVKSWHATLHLVQSCSRHFRFLLESCGKGCTRICYCVLPRAAGKYKTTSGSGNCFNCTFNSSTHSIHHPIPTRLCTRTCALTICTTSLTPIFLPSTMGKLAEISVCVALNDIFESRAFSTQSSIQRLLLEHA